MAPTSIHTILSRDNDSSLGEMFQHFPATLWKFFKDFVIGLSVILAFFAIIFAVFLTFLWIYTYGPDLVKGLTRVSMREATEGLREQIWRLRRIQGLDRMWVWLKGGSPRKKAGAVDAEELSRLDSHDGEGREGSVGGETLLDDEEVQDKDENGQASKMEEMELDSEDYMNGEA